jgi:membrane protease YdiL (CAAX protease family)
MQPPKPKVKSGGIIALLLVFSALLNGCVEAVPPAFDFQDNLIIIDALASTVPGTSYATVQQTSYEFGLYRSKAISGCSIKLINADTQEEEVLFESDESYVVDPNFKVDPLSRWLIEIRLPDGETYRSSVEATPEQVLTGGLLDTPLQLTLAVIAAVVLAPVAEELLFRGLLHRGLRRRLRIVPATALSSVLFAVVHVDVALSQPLALVGLTLVGVILAVAYERTGSLIVPVVIHAVHNAVTITAVVVSTRLDLDLVGAGIGAGIGAGLVLVGSPR